MGKFTLRYGKLFNLGNYENERIDLEEEFPTEMPREQALQTLKASVNRLRGFSKNLDEETARRQRDIQAEEERRAEIDNLLSRKEDIEARLLELTRKEGHDRAT